MASRACCMIAVGVAFEQDLLSATGQTIGWMIVFFFASPAASSAYLTVSETFPIEIRALAIAIFYAIGTGRRRRRRAVRLRQADRKRLAGQNFRRLCLRRLSDACRRDRRVALRDQRRAQIPRAGGEAAVGGGVGVCFTGKQTASSQRPSPARTAKRPCPRGRGTAPSGCPMASPSARAPPRPCL